MNSSRLCLRDSAKRKPAVGRKKIAAYGHNKSGINISVVFNTRNAGRETERDTGGATTSPAISLPLRRVCGEGRAFTYHRFPPWEEKPQWCEAIEDKNQLSLSGQIESRIRVRCVFNDFANEIYSAMTNHMENSTRYWIFLGISGRELADVLDRE